MRLLTAGSSVRAGLQEPEKAVKIDAICFDRILMRFLSIFEKFDLTKGSLSIVGVKIVKCNFYYMYIYMYANINSSSYVGNVEKSKTYPYYPHICKF